MEMPFNYGGMDDMDEQISNLGVNDNMPEFIVKQFGEHYEIWLVEPITAQLRERFGPYKSEREAEQEARKLQAYAERLRYGY